MNRRAILPLLVASLLGPIAGSAEPQAEAALRVVVIRHANAWKNVPTAQRPRAMSEAELDSLTPKGEQRAAQIGRELAEQGVVAVYCSPARRARQTAEAIAKALDLPAPTVSEAFRTLDKGSDARAASGTVRARSWQAGDDPRPPGGESLGDGFARASAELAALREKHAGHAIAVVTHGEIAATLRAKAAGQDILRGYFDQFPAEGSAHEIAVASDGTLGAAQ